MTSTEDFGCRGEAIAVGWCSAQGPAGGSVGEAEVDESSEVDRGDADGECVLVAVDADGSGRGDDHARRARRWIVRPWVAIADSRRRSRRGAMLDVLDEFDVVVADLEDAAVFRGGASKAECAAVAADPERSRRLWWRSGGVTAGTRRGACVVIDDEVVAVEPAWDRAPQRDRFDRLVVTRVRVTQRGPRRSHTRCPRSTSGPMPLRSSSNTPVVAISRVRWSTPSHGTRPFRVRGAL